VDRAQTVKEKGRQADIMIQSSAFRPSPSAIFVSVGVKDADPNTSFGLRYCTSISASTWAPSIVSFSVSGSVRATSAYRRAARS
jgi:hypothetical protein